MRIDDIFENWLKVGVASTQDTGKEHLCGFYSSRDYVSSSRGGGIYSAPYI